MARADCTVERVIWDDLFGGWPSFSARLRPHFRFPSGSVNLWAAN